LPFLASSGRTRHAGPGTSGSCALWPGVRSPFHPASPRVSLGSYPAPECRSHPREQFAAAGAVPAPSQAPACSGWLSIIVEAVKGRAGFPLAGTDVSRETGQDFALRSASG